MNEDKAWAAFGWASCVLCVVREIYRAASGDGDVTWFVILMLLVTYWTWRLHAAWHEQDGAT